MTEEQNPEGVANNPEGDGGAALKGNLEPRIENLEEAGGAALSQGSSSSAELRSTDPFFSGRKHYPALDGLRALAIIGVICLHFGGVLTPEQVRGLGVVGRGIYKFFTHGAWGVDLFFVLSGYLITGILLSSRGQEHYFRNFYARRTLRIFPLYYGTLLAVLVLLPLVLGHVPAMISAAYSHQVWLWTYTTNIECARRDGQVFGNFLHFWTLAIEEQFYLVWPLVVFLTPPRWLLRLALIGIVAVNAGRMSFIILQWTPGYGWDPVTVYNWLASLTLFRADSLLAGAALAVLQADGALLQWRGTFRWIFPAAVGAIVVFLLAVPRLVSGLPTPVVAHVTLAPILFGTGVGYLLTCRADSWLVRGLSIKPLRAIGKYSYAMYVFHYIYLPLEVRWLPCSSFVRLVHDPLLGLLAYYASAIGIAFCVAFLSYHLYEKHFLKLKKYFPERVVAAPAAAASINTEH